MSGLSFPSSLSPHFVPQHAQQPSLSLHILLPSLHKQKIDPTHFPEISIVAAQSARWPFVGQFIQRLGFSIHSPLTFCFMQQHNTNKSLSLSLSLTLEHIVSPNNQIASGQFVWPCTAPLRHPYQWQRVRNVLGLKHSNPAANKVLSALARSLIHSQPTTPHICRLFISRGLSEVTLMRGEP